MSLCKHLELARKCERCELEALRKANNEMASHLDRISGAIIDSGAVAYDDYSKSVRELTGSHEKLRAVLEKVLKLATWDEEEHNDELPDEDDMTDALVEIHILVAGVLRPTPPISTDNS